METKGTILNKSIQILAYADDVDIVRRKTNAVNKAYTALLKAAQRMGLSINQDKTKYMEAIERPNTQLHIIFDSHCIEVVKELRYLGTTVMFHNIISKEIKDRLIMANKCHYGVKRQFRSHHLTLKTKC
jgi:hypothetical protein